MDAALAPVHRPGGEPLLEYSQRGGGDSSRARAQINLTCSSFVAAALRSRSLIPLHQLMASSEKPVKGQKAQVPGPMGRSVDRLPA
jgi:hypothetical protein